MARMPHPCSKLTMLETIWVMVRDSTVDSGGTSACLLYQIPHRLLADGLSLQHGCRQVRDDHLAGKDRHNYSYGYQMMSGGLPVSLPSRLTESTVSCEDRI